MEREKVELPSLHRPLMSSRIHSLEDYCKWEHEKKRAYHAELNEEVEEHRRSRERVAEQKRKDKVDISMLVQEERAKMASDKYSKTKTQQKYMQQNFRLIKQGRSPLRNKEWSCELREHPFVCLIEGEQNRKKQTRNNFIAQNQLNDIQSEVKRSMRMRRKKFEEQQGKNYTNHVEEEFERQLRERALFENKYLKIDKGNRNNVKKEHLEYLKGQAQLRHSYRLQKVRDNSIEAVNSSLSNLGQLPVASDRKKQLETLQKSLKMFSSPQSIPQNQLSFRKQYDMAIGGSTPRHLSYEKPVAQESGQVSAKIKQPTERAQSSLNGSQNNMIKYRPVYELSERSVKPALREFRHYDIIKNSEKIIVN